MAEIVFVYVFPYSRLLVWSIANISFRLVNLARDVRMQSILVGYVCYDTILRWNSATLHVEK